MKTADRIVLDDPRWRKGMSKPRNMKNVCHDLAAAIARAADKNGRGEMFPKTACLYTRRVRPSQIGWIMGRPAWLEFLNTKLASHGLTVSDYDRRRRPPAFVVGLASVEAIRKAKEQDTFGPV